ncbi:MAG: ATP-binding cassette domain-containing protein, partial [Bilophila wadsworthia]
PQTDFETRRTMEDTLLEVRDLQVEFSTKMGIVRVLDKVNLKVDPRQTVGIIGESGCGKSMMALSIMGLVPIPPGRIAGGEILYRGTDLLTLEKTPSSTSGESGSP